MLPEVIFSTDRTTLPDKSVIVKRKGALPGLLNQIVVLRMNGLGYIRKSVEEAGSDKWLLPNLTPPVVNDVATLHDELLPIPQLVLIRH